MKLRVDHIGIAVADLGEAAARFATLLRRAPSPVEEVPSEGVRLCFFELDGCRLELLEPTTPSSPIRKFLERGRKGVHHISLALEGESIETLFSELVAGGVPVLGEKPKAGSGGSRIFFVHPDAAAGVLMEFASRERANDGEAPGDSKTSEGR
jgi:methylmalonyl-CoA/ethylmalonyl-CoA epimerase